MPLDQTPTEIDTATALQLGLATYKFLARRGEQSDEDEFTWEDQGVAISVGFLELDSELAQTVRSASQAAIEQQA